MSQRILVADDEEAMHRLISRTLTTSNREVVAASDGAQALELARTLGPDLIVLDVKMPRKSGWEVLKELRGHALTRAMPVIMLTGCGSICDEVAGLDMGADDYIAKPFQPEGLRARVMSILRRTQLDLSVNPLTRLPGSPSIEAEVNRRIAGQLPFAFLYADIDNFKPYNDCYGFAQGDKVIWATAHVLAESIRAGESADAFLGHVGGDDFVMVTDIAAAPHLAQRAVSLFDRKAVAFYDPADLSRGYIEAQDRQGRSRRFPLLTLSMGVATSERRRLDHYAKVVSIANEMKSFCKSQPADRFSRFAFDRRRDPHDLSGI
ncbi:MAG: response regulator [Elusimicrobia bacterium]|nr:response regulator [Elusimicrobiota bacterium]